MNTLLSVRASWVTKTVQAVMLVAFVVIGSALFAGVASAANVNFTSVSPATGTVGTSADLTLVITNDDGTNITDGDSLTITFPDSFPNFSETPGGVGEADLMDLLSVTPLGASAVTMTAAGVAGKVLTINFATAAGNDTVAVADFNTAADTITIVIDQGSDDAGTIAPDYADATSTFTLAEVVGASWNVGTATQDMNVSSAALTSTNVEPNVKTLGVTTNATVTFTTVNAIDNNAKIVVIFPSGYDVSGLATTAAASASDIDGTLTVGVSSQTVTITRSGGSEVSAASTIDDLIITGVVNPTAAGTSGTYTISTTDASDNGYDTDAAVTGDVFVTANSSNPDVSAPRTLQVDVPNGGEVLMGMSSTTLTWTSTGEGAFVANLEYSVDGGLSWMSIAEGEANDGSYLWTVPDVDTKTASFRVTTADSNGLSSLSDVSDGNFEIQATGVVVEDEVTPEPGIDVVEDAPFESISLNLPNGSSSALAAGGLFRGETLSGVYQVNADGSRSVFPTLAVFMSHYDNFDAVVTVSDDQLSKLSLGPRMTMAAGSLVKIQSDPKVYEVQSDGTVLHVPDEATAISTYGSDWASLVTDISVAFWNDYPRG